MIDDVREFIDFLLHNIATRPDGRYCFLLLLREHVTESDGIISVDAAGYMARIQDMRKDETE